jgi:hypothetical protein
LGVCSGSSRSYLRFQLAARAAARSITSGFFAGWPSIIRSRSCPTRPSAVVLADREAEQLGDDDVHGVIAAVHRHRVVAAAVDAQVGLVWRRLK